jgi:hypothetical protein
VEAHDAQAHRALAHGGVGGAGEVVLGPGECLGVGEQIQRAFPDARVVKTLNTVNCKVMVDPARVPGEHDVFVCGDDAPAKVEVVALLRSFSWPVEHIVDLGDITAARATEAYLLLWLRLRGATETSDFNIRVAH